MDDRPRLLDLYCCQGGAARGYENAGFRVTGVDKFPQSRYPGQFYQCDAIWFIKRNLKWIQDNFTLIHGSPPCQLYSLTWRINKNEDHPDLIGATRDALELTGLPYVLENVEDARSELRNPITLCGPTFGLHTYRHRLFETKGLILKEPPHPEHLYDNVKMGRALEEGDFYHAVGNFSGVSYVRRDLKVPWMNREGIKECIPPAYAEHVGRQFLEANK